jgi:hypothetical protein
VLDLDETLVHASVTTAGFLLPPTFSEAIPTLGGAELYHVWERPFVHAFLRSMSRLYNIVVFTAAAPAYADPILDRIDHYRVIKRRYYRADCVAKRFRVPAHTHTRDTSPTTAAAAAAREGHEREEEVHLVKDLTILDVPLSNVLLLDNSRYCISQQRYNSILVPAYYPPCTAGCRHSHQEGACEPGKPKRSLRGHSGSVQDCDDVLEALVPLLEALWFVPDIRCVLEATTRPA